MRCLLVSLNLSLSTPLYLCIDRRGREGGGENERERERGERGEGRVREGGRERERGISDCECNVLTDFGHLGVQ